MQSNIVDAGIPFYSFHRDKSIRAPELQFGEENNRFRGALYVADSY